MVGFQSRMADDAKARKMGFIPAHSQYVQCAGVKEKKIRVRMDAWMAQVNAGSPADNNPVWGLRGRGAGKNGEGQQQGDSSLFAFMSNGEQQNENFSQHGY